MLRLTLHRLAPVFVGAAVTAAAAQPSPPRRADPLDPRAAVPGLAYTSPLDGYRRFDAAGAPRWYDVNDTVGRIGGWRAYAREAQTPAQPASAPATAAHRHP